MTEPAHRAVDPVEVDATVQLDTPPSIVQTVAVVAIGLALVLGLAGVVALTYVGRDTPDVLDVSLGGLVGALAALLRPTRG